jgi:nucleoside-diphosphate-sugar epimerase
MHQDFAQPAVAQVPPITCPHAFDVAAVDLRRSSGHQRYYQLVLLRRTQECVRSSVVSLSLAVHGEGDHHGFVPRLITSAREQGFSAYIGDGSNRWPAVHRLDAAHLFRLALEGAPAGSQLDGVGDEGVPSLDIADVIGRHLNRPVASIAPEEAEAHFGPFLGGVAARDFPRSSARTQELLGWRLVHPGLIADPEQGPYFNP